MRCVRSFSNALKSIEASPNSCASLKFAGHSCSMFSPVVWSVVDVGSREFPQRYRQGMTRIRELLQQGADPRQVIMPYGTLLMRTRHGFRCEDPQLTWCILARAPS